MPIRRRLLLFALLAASAAFDSAAARAQPVVLVVRHAEKISDQDERLSDAGIGRAERLAEMLKRSGISAIYSTDIERTIGTAKPLADALGLKIRIYDVRPVEDRFDFAPFVERLREEAPDGIVLVVGHSNTVPPLLRALGCAEDVSIASGDYGNLFVVMPKGTGKATLVRLRY